MANEKRLIDGNALKGKLIRELNKTGKYTPYECGLDDAITYLDKQPTVDAVEVVNGHWTTLYKVDTWMGTSEIDCFICSECGKGSKAKGNYCPNCGARMR